MTDTHPKITAMMDLLMAQKTGADRVAMGFSMLSFAKEIAISSIRTKYPEIGPKELRKQLFLRLYSDDFTEKQKQAILTGL